MSSKESCECAKCQSGCQHKPGWFKPGEAERAAQYLGLSVEEFFQTKLGVDWWIRTEEEDIYVLAPAITKHPPGREYPGDPRGVCIFFVAGRCAIHPVKPFVCREAWHELPDYEATLNAQVADEWDSPTHQDQIQTLLGRRPSSSDFTLAAYYDIYHPRDGRGESTPWVDL